MIEPTILTSLPAMEGKQIVAVRTYCDNELVIRFADDSMISIYATQRWESLELQVTEAKDIGPGHKQELGFYTPEEAKAAYERALKESQERQRQRDKEQRRRDWLRLKQEFGE